MGVDPKRLEQIFEACPELRGSYQLRYDKERYGWNTQHVHHSGGGFLKPVDSDLVEALVCDAFSMWLAKRSIHIGYAAMQSPAWFAFTHCLGKMESVTTGGHTSVRIESDDRTKCVMWAVEHELKLPEWTS